MWLLMVLNEMDIWCALSVHKTYGAAFRAGWNQHKYKSWKVQKG